MAEPVGVRKLPPLLGIVAADLRTLFRPALLEYQQHLRDRRGYPVGPKVFNDPIWHTIRLEPWEAVILDSPLVQRLRGIHQLGLAYFVFPGAGYSRFEHSIGVLNQTQRFIESINRNARTSSIRQLDPIQPSDEILVRLAALLHDIGHGFLSHVSERAASRLLLRDKATLRDLTIEAKPFFRCRKNPALAEVLAALMVLLPETIDLLAMAEIPRWADSADLADHVAHLIVGSTRYSTRPFLSEIISGSVDADKLDYMARDCYMAGLPMPVDVERLLQKVHVVGVLAGDLPQGYETQFELQPDDVVQVFAVQEPGGRTVEELVVSRVLLYQKLYHHQKVRAMEGAIENAIDLLAAGEPTFQTIEKYLQLSDEEFLKGHWGILKRPDAAETKRARPIVSDVANRRPLVRAFAFGSMMIADTLTDKEQRRGWGKLAPRVSRGRTDDYFAFRQRIVQLAQKYLEAAGESDAARRLDEHSIVSDLPDVQGIAEKTKFWVGDEHTGLELYSDRTRVERWAEAYEAQKSVGFIYCPSEHAVAVHLAVRDLIREETGLTFDNRSLSLTKVRTATLAAFIKTLRDRGLDVQELTKSGEKPRVVSQPTAAELRDLYGTRIQALAATFQTYQGADGAAVDADRIVQWLLQFRREDIAHAVRILECVEYWDRRATADALARGLATISDLPSAEIVPFGGADKSAHHLMYLIPDVRAQMRGVDLRVCGSLSDLKGTGHIVLFDDIAASGTQGATTMLQYFDRPDTEWEVEERVVEPADPRALELLRALPITFVFMTGSRDGAAHIIDVTKKLVGHDRVAGYVVSPSEIGCFEPAARVFQDNATAKVARTAFEAIGRLALHDKLDRWGNDKLESRVLGYGNAAALTVFYYNVPSASLTALWKENLEKSHRWKPLFHRRTAERVPSAAAEQASLFVDEKKVTS